MKDQGDLREYFKITPQGSEYLQLRQAMEEGQQVPIDSPK
jgi:DNA-binding PadR family transcriptional regulator